MQLIDKFFNFLGYIPKKAQISPPSSYPYDEKFPQNNEDEVRRKLIDKSTPPNEQATPQPSSYPEQLSGSPDVPLPKTNVETYGGEAKQVPTNYNRDTLITPGLTTQPKVDPNETHIKNRLMMDIQDVDHENHAIAMKMKAVGIKNIDKELFYEKLNNLKRKAALRKQPFSDYLNEIL